MVVLEQFQALAGAKDTQLLAEEDDSYFHLRNFLEEALASASVAVLEAADLSFLAELELDGLHKKILLLLLASVAVDLNLDDLKQQSLSMSSSVAVVVVVAEDDHIQLLEAAAVLEPDAAVVDA